MRYEEASRIEPNPITNEPMRSPYFLLNVSDNPVIYGMHKLKYLLFINCNVLACLHPASNDPTNEPRLDIDTAKPCIHRTMIILLVYYLLFELIILQLTVKHS